MGVHVSLGFLPFAIFITLVSHTTGRTAAVLPLVVMEVIARPEATEPLLPEEERLAQYVMPLPDKRVAAAATFIVEADEPDPLLPSEGNSNHLKELVEKVRHQITRLQQLRKDKATATSDDVEMNASRFRAQRVKLCYFSAIQCLFAFKSANKANKANVDDSV